ncbi:MAG: two-component system, OmpR family, sensor histidine kinase BaeS [Verrucomicrobiota bacterium]|jgi:K+-sensing histidine kinase KdpD
MAPSGESNSTPSSEIQIPLPDVVKFVRQLAHDLRNHLNAAELQSAYLAEIVDDAESKEEIKRLRKMISEIGANLQSVTTALSTPKLTEMSYAAADFIGDLRQKLATDYADQNAKVRWDIEVGSATLNIDPQLLLPALIELFANAFRHDPGEGAISAAGRIENDRFVFTIHEPKQKFEGSTENWGREPLRSIRQGHYGLGLHRARGVIEAHRGELDTRYDNGASRLITKVTLPLAPPD